MYGKRFEEIEKLNLNDISEEELSEIEREVKNKKIKNFITYLTTITLGVSTVLYTNGFIKNDLSNKLEELSKLYEIPLLLLINFGLIGIVIALNEYVLKSLSDWVKFSDLKEEIEEIKQEEV